MESRSHLCGGTWKMLYFSERKLRARISSIMTYIKKIFVLASPKLAMFRKKIQRNIGHSTTTPKKTRVLTSLEKTLSFGFRGGLCIMSGSGGATPSASAGGPSVAKLM